MTWLCNRVNGGGCVDTHDEAGHGRDQSEGVWGSGTGCLKEGGGGTLPVGVGLTEHFCASPIENRTWRIIKAGTGCGLVLTSV